MLAQIKPKRRLLIHAIKFALLILLGGIHQMARAQNPREVIQIDPNRPSHSFPHYWERMFGSGRAILSLRASYRDDLRMLKASTGVEYVRFHAIFHDEIGLYNEDNAGTPIYNFSYIDQIYDGLLDEGVRPFV